MEQKANLFENQIMRTKLKYFSNKTPKPQNPKTPLFQIYLRYVICKMEGTILLNCLCV